MKILCPTCSAPLEIIDGESAQCKSQCGKTFRILFHRDQPVTTVVAQAFLQGDGRAVLLADKKCPQHPESAAEHVCAACDKLLCRMCAYLQADGTARCENCVAQDRSETGAAAGETPGKTSEVAEGEMCVNHAGVPAVVHCKICRTAICATCDFTFPKDLHFCPKCVVFEGEGLSSRRKKMLVWSCVSAGLATLLLLGFLGAAANASYDRDATGLLIFLGFLTLAASVTGTGLGFTAIEKHRKNSIMLWIAAIWNLVIVGIYVLLSIVGTFSS